MGTFCPNPKSICKKFAKNLQKICKKFAKDLQKNWSKFAKILQKVVAKKSAKLQIFCRHGGSRLVFSEEVKPQPLLMSL